MITRIGIAAGDIWHYLEHNPGSIKLSKIKDSLDCRVELILMSVGWLAREGHIVVEEVDDDYIIWLRDKE